MDHATVFITLSDNGNQLTIDGNLNLLHQFLSTFQNASALGKQRPLPRRGRSSERIHIKAPARKTDE